METAIGEYFRVQFPDDWREEEKYGFNWHEISSELNPFDKINYDDIKLKQSEELSKIKKIIP